MTSQPSAAHHIRLARLPRITVRALLWLAGIAFAVHLLLSQVGEFRQTVQTARDVRWGWLVLGVVGVAINFVASALCQMGAVERSVPLGRTIVVQVAAAFMSLLTPQGVGGMSVNVRYLGKEGLPTRAAVGAVATNFAAGYVVHFLLLALVLLPARAMYLGRLRVPAGGPVLGAILVAVLVLGVIFWSPVGRRGVVVPVMTAGRDLGRILQRPVRALQLFGGSAAVTGTFILTLAACLQAFGASVPLIQVATVYLLAVALASLSPTPGGLGALEVALVAGLTGFSVPASTAIAGVLVYRLLTFWLPMLPGIAAYRYLRRGKYI